MQDTAKYLIHAKLSADGVIERSDVVGAVFGQTEGLLGDEMDLRDLQDSSKVGRIDVSVETEGGQSFGDVTIASSLDKVETAILAASLETISRVGPCQARIEVTNIEDVRAAKRRIVVQRAKELLANSFEETVLTSDELHEEVRESVRAGEMNQYEGLPAGPNVEDGDAIVVVEGRADVARLLEFGVKNAVAVEGTNVPDAVAELTEERTTTAFLDGDRGGQLILRELGQVGDVDFVAFAPEGRSVEELPRGELLAALREKTPYEVYERARQAGDPDSAREVATGGSSGETAETAPVVDGEAPPLRDDGRSAPANRSPDSGGGAESDGRPGDEAAASTADRSSAAIAQPSLVDQVEDADTTDSPDESAEASATLRDHVREVVGENAGTVRLLDDDWEPLTEAPATDAYETVDGAESAHALVLDGELDQRTLDAAADRDLQHAVARTTGEFVKQPATPHVRPVDGFLT
ncbi:MULTISPECIES: DNA primase DnaG [Halolamina]|uniref:DNA primase DnaG n=1 Tax=Halolamina pelagica TaxID=699431 RepID=A0A1I5QTU3_9EURY|nr:MULTISPECIES: DNA primase DnaG [Halolamina]NHX35533.1 DNA primase [Halolamina sp. R1-12]SFP49507.1 DNA primase [Halolamina pelagica]